MKNKKKIAKIVGGLIGIGAICCIIPACVISCGSSTSTTTAPASQSTYNAIANDYMLQGVQTPSSTTATKASTSSTAAPLVNISVGNEVNATVPITYLQDPDTCFNLILKNKHITATELDEATSGTFITVTPLNAMNYDVSLLTNANTPLSVSSLAIGGDTNNNTQTFGKYTFSTLSQADWNYFYQSYQASNPNQNTSPHYYPVGAIFGINDSNIKDGSNNQILPMPLLNQDGQWYITGYIPSFTMIINGVSYPVQSIPINIEVTPFVTICGNLPASAFYNAASALNQQIDSNSTTNAQTYLQYDQQHWGKAVIEGINSANLYLPTPILSNWKSIEVAGQPIGQTLGGYNSVFQITYYDGIFEWAMGGFWFTGLNLDKLVIYAPPTNLDFQTLLQDATASK